MKGLLGFVAGLALGAVAALLLAPETGEELRRQVQDLTSRDMNRLQNALQRDMAELNTRLTSMQTELQRFADQVEDEVAAELEPEDDTSGESEA